MRDVTVRSGKSVIKRIKSAHKKTSSPRTPTTFEKKAFPKNKVKYITLKKTIKTVKIPKITKPKKAILSSRRFKSTPNSVKIAIDPLKSLYKLTGHNEPLVHKSNRIPVYMAHTRITPMANFATPPPLPAARTKKCAFCSQQRPSSYGTSAYQRTEAKLAAALRTPDKKANTKGIKNKGGHPKPQSKAKASKTPAKRGPIFEPAKAAKASKVVSKEKTVSSKKPAAKTLKLKASGFRFTPGSKVKPPKRAVQYFKPKLISRLS